MSILIKGIDLPKCSNEDCIVVIRKDKAEVWQTGFKERTVEAIQIDRPHGRIGDLDGVIKQIDESPTFASKYKGTARLFIDVYSDSNTILEAEE